MIWLVAIVALAGCGIQETGGGTGLDLPWLDVVRQCDATRADPYELVALELCSPLSDSALEASLDANGFEGATCWPTDRHAGPCIFGCTPHSGCNSFNGCWCPP